MSVTIRPAAKADLVTACEWYEDQRSGLGEEFLLSIAESMLQLEKTPTISPFYYRDFRRILTTTFPYKIFYRIEGDSVMVFRILHAARDHIGQLPR